MPNLVPPSPSITPALAARPCHQPVVLGVGSDPEPDHFIPVPFSQGAPVQADADRVIESGGVDLLEMQGRMARVAAPQLVGFAGVAPHGFGQGTVEGPEARCGAGLHSFAYGESKSRGVVLPALCSFRASSARDSKTSWDSASVFSQRSSESISSSRIAAYASCSSSGSLASRSNAFFNNFVMPDRINYRSMIPKINIPPEGM